MQIDYVFPFVDPTDREWQKSYSNYFSDRAWNTQRFRDLGFLKYVYRGIAANMPWLHSVIMLVASKSQIPEWLTTEENNLRIVTHEEFIPKKYLPTFNSNTIEMHLGNIPNVSEYIIYGNDDFIPLNPMEEDDYFTKQYLPKLSFDQRHSTSTVFQQMCKKCWNLAADYFQDAKLSGNSYYKIAHEPQPITLTSIKETSRRLKNEITCSITRKRSLNQNLCQYIYYTYIIAANRYQKRERYHVYKELRSTHKDDIIRTIIGNKSAKWVVLNDTETTNLNIIDEIIVALNQRYPDKCIYER